MLQPNGPHLFVIPASGVSDLMILEACKFTWLFITKLWRLHGLSWPCDINPWNHATFDHLARHMVNTSTVFENPLTIPSLVIMLQYGFNNVWHVTWPGKMAVKKDHILGIPIPYLPIHYTSFMELQWHLVASVSTSICIVCMCTNLTRWMLPRMYLLLQ